MTGKVSKKLNIGDVYAIPMPNGKYAFGRTFKDACIAIYQHIGDDIQDIPKMENYQFTVGVYKDVLKSGQWIKVENRPFSNADEQWPPPMCVIDSISANYSIYHKGEIRPASKVECEGLEIASVWEAEHIIS